MRNMSLVIMDEDCNSLPNILITGTPGVGKSYICERLSKQLNCRWLDCSTLALEHNFLEMYDEEYETAILDEDKLLNYLEPIMQQGANIVEYHGCDFFPERWFRAVFVMTCSNTVLFHRLKERQYNERKIRSNLECEIFETIVEEAKNSYNNNIVHILKGDTEEDAERSLKIISDWYQAC